MNKYSIDRIEDGFAVVEYDGNFFEVVIDNLPDGAKEGDILFKNEDGRFEIDKVKTAEEKARLNKKQNDLFCN